MFTFHERLPSSHHLRHVNLGFHKNANLPSAGGLSQRAWQLVDAGRQSRLVGPGGQRKLHNKCHNTKPIAVHKGQGEGGEGRLAGSPGELSAASWGRGARGTAWRAKPSVGTGGQRAEESCIFECVFPGLQGSVRIVQLDGGAPVSTDKD